MKKLNKIKYLQNIFFIEFLENILEGFKIKNLILHLFLLKQRVIFNFTLGHINKNSKVIKIFLKKNLEIGLK